VPHSLVLEEIRRQALYTSGVVVGRTNHMGYGLGWVGAQPFIVKSKLGIVLKVEILDLV